MSALLEVVRWSLTGQHAESVGSAFALVPVWCVAALALGARVATRRR